MKHGKPLYVLIWARVFLVQLHLHLGVFQWSLDTHFETTQDHNFNLMSDLLSNRDSSLWAYFNIHDKLNFIRIANTTSQFNNSDLVMWAYINISLITFWFLMTFGRVSWKKVMSVKSNKLISMNETKKT